MAKAKKPQSRDATPQSRAKPGLSRARAWPKFLKTTKDFAATGKTLSRAKYVKPFNECVDFLRKAPSTSVPPSKDSFQLIRIIEGTKLMHGFQAEVNWYTGGNSYVTLPTAVAAKGFQGPGFYLAMTKWVRMKDVPEEDWGPQTPVASICKLRWKGTDIYFRSILSDLLTRKILGKKKYNRLLQMLDRPSDAEEGI